MTDVLVFEGLDLGANVIPVSGTEVIVPQRQFRQASPYQAGASLPPSQPRWTRHNNVPLKPTKKRMRDFFVSSAQKLQRAGGVTDEQARSQLSLIDEELFRLKHEIEDAIPILKQLSRKAQTLTGTPGERTRAEALGYASIMIRNVTRLIKLAVARQAVNVAIDNPKQRSLLFAFASTIREIPVKIKIPKTFPEDMILSSEKTARAMISSKGRQVKYLARKAPAQSLAGFSFGSAFKPVETWFKDTVNEAAGAVKDEVVSFARDTSADLLKEGKKAIGDAIPRVVGPGLATGADLLSKVSGGAGLTSAPATIVAQGATEVTSPWATAKKFVLPAVVILGGGYLVTRFI